jgi:hypothetical protein
MAWDSGDDTVAVDVDGEEVEVSSDADFSSTIDDLINEHNIGSAVVSYEDEDGAEYNDIKAGDAPDTFENVASATIDKAKDMA